jgi:hypothetical protein
LHFNAPGINPTRPVNVFCSANVAHFQYPRDRRPYSIPRAVAIRENGAKRIRNWTVASLSNSGIGYSL